MCGKLHAYKLLHEKEPKTEEQFENMNILYACLEVNKGE